MPTIRDFLIKDEMAIQASGTPEGAIKGWDRRGRGRAKKNFEPPSSTVKKQTFVGGWKRGGRNEGEGYKGHFTSFFDHPKHGTLEIKHSGPFRENPVTVKHNGKRVFTGNHDTSRSFLMSNYGIRYGSSSEQGS